MSSITRFAGLALVMSVLVVLRIDAQQPGAAGISGPWEGSIQVAVGTLQMRVVFTETPGELRAAIDIPQQNAAGLPLAAVTRTGSNVHFELPTPTARAVFDGRVSGNTISGTFAQGQVSGTFELTRIAPAGNAPKAAYAEQEIAITTGPIRRAGTLTIPSGSGPFPFVVMITGNGQSLAERQWGTGFLPSKYQGVKLRSVGDPVLYVSNPVGFEPAQRARFIEDLERLNQLQYDTTQNPEIATRIAQYEMAFRMQTSVPELTDLSKEPEHTFELYGPESRRPGTYAANCLMARRLAERGVRFIQVYNRAWDHHSGLPKAIRATCQQVDQPSAGLIQDLKEHGHICGSILVCRHGRHTLLIQAEG